MNAIMREHIINERKRIALQLFKYSLYVDEISAITRLSVREINLLQELKEISEWMERILTDHFENTCFYCGKPLSEGKRRTHADDYIPWSFVQSDNIWNLVLACSTCNTSKSDKLPERHYLDTIMERNEVLYQRASEKAVSDLMANYKEKKIILLYDYSIKNGFDTMWSPR